MNQKLTLARVVVEGGDLAVAAIASLRTIGAFKLYGRQLVERAAVQPL